MRNENCDRKSSCDDYKHNHCEGCGGNKPKGDLISREALKKQFANECLHNCYYCKLSKWDKEGVCYNCGLIDNAPTVEQKFKPIAEVKFDKEQLQEIVDKAKAEILESVEKAQGEWIWSDNRWNLGDWLCNICEHYAHDKSNFCPNCGADMRKGDKDNGKS